MAKAKAWEAEYARKCQPLKPIKIGLIWECDVTMESGEGLLSQYTAVPLVPLPVTIGTQSKGECTTPSATNTGIIVEYYYCSTTGIFYSRLTSTSCA